MGIFHRAYLILYSDGGDRSWRIKTKRVLDFGQKSNSCVATDYFIFLPYKEKSSGHTQPIVVVACCAKIQHVTPPIIPHEWTMLRCGGGVLRMWFSKPQAHDLFNAIISPQRHEKDESCSFDSLILSCKILTVIGQTPQNSPPASPTEANLEVRRACTASAPSVSSIA